MRLLSRRRRAADPAGPTASDATETLRGSGLFDSDWYVARYPDVASAGVDAFDHYVSSGADEGRDPNAFFSSGWYLDTYADVRAAGVNPLLHYWTDGAAEGRSAGPEFDTAYYLAQNPEVEAAGLHPLVHYLHHGRHEGRGAKPHDEAEAFEVAVSAKAQALSGAAATLFRGPRADRVHFALDAASRPADGTMPLPPLRLARRIGSETLDDFDASGRAIRDTIVRSLPDGFTWDGSRCLDFGSGVGRALRHFRAEAERAEFWGCDIDGPSIRWSVQNLSPPFRFVQIGEVPSMPFEDESFDLVYSISVLSHIHSTWHQWLAEIRRVLKPGGVFFVSFMGQTPMEEMLGEPYRTRGDDFGMLVKGPFQNWNDGGPMIFVSPDWIERFWGSLFDIDYIAMDGLMDYQSFCLMRKPKLGAPIKRDVPVLEVGTRQDFDPDAVGRITPQFDARAPFRDSYGVHVRAARDVAITGWVALRRDVPDGVDLLVDGVPVPARGEITPGEPYRDWPETLRHAFAVRADLLKVSAGAHRLEARVRRRTGGTHVLEAPLLVR